MRVKSAATAVMATLVLWAAGFSGSGFCMGKGPITPDGHFLSVQNPIATAEQRDLEALAMRLMQTPAVKSGREKAVLRWKAAVRSDPTPEQWAMFDAAMEEYAFNFCMKAANSDPNYPKIMQLFQPAHEWFGMKVPGSRLGGDNPDNSYRLVPIDGNARYEIRGRRFANSPSDVTFTLVANFSTSKTLASLEGRDLKVTDDGVFTLTIDPEPANGRANHIQSSPAVLYLFIRDSRGDWRQLPNALTVKRLDPPAAPPLTEQQLAQRAAEIMVDEVPLTYWFMRFGGGGTPNTMSKPFVAGAFAGGLVSQVNVASTLRVNDDEAVVVTVHPAGAAFRNIVLHDYWYRSIDYPHHTSSMNNSQGVANADGTYTYVVSIRDPGVHNWLDTAGLHEVIANHRWQGLPRGKSASGEPAISAQLVKLQDLPSILPKGTKRVTPAERQQQLAERLASYKFRLIDR